jgi:flagellar basal-body rod modification protein FlgD
VSIDSTLPVTGSPTTPVAQPKKADVMGKDAFLSLLVTQMKNQDPSKPVDNSAMIAQLAQFSSLEQMQQMNVTLTGIASYFANAQALVNSATTTTATTAPADAATTTNKGTN